MFIKYEAKVASRLRAGSIVLG